MLRSILEELEASTGEKVFPEQHHFEEQKTGELENFFAQKQKKDPEMKISPEFKKVSENFCKQLHPDNTHQKQTE
jgi:hypothetical protein